MVRTFLVKTANSVAMAAERCVMMVALMGSLEKATSNFDDSTGSVCSNENHGMGRPDRTRRREKYDWVLCRKERLPRLET